MKLRPRPGVVSEIARKFAEPGKVLVRRDDLSNALDPLDVTPESHRSHASAGFGNEGLNDGVPYMPGSSDIEPKDAEAGAVIEKISVGASVAFLHVGLHAPRPTSWSESLRGPAGT
jgi:hypothetical protein